MEKKKKVIFGVAIAVVVIAAIVVAVLIFRQNKEQGTEQNTAQSTEQKTGQSSEEHTEQKTTQSTEQNMEQNEMKVMSLANGEDNSLFIDTENGTLFTLTFPEEEIYDKEGNKITSSQLVRGNILHVYGNGIMLESYPGQYPGVTRIRVVETGKPEDADQYNDLTDMYYQEPDPSAVPTIHVEYSMPRYEALVSSATTMGGYEWTYEKEDGTSVTDTTDSQHVMEWKEIVEISARDPLDLKLIVNKATQVEVVRWPEKMRQEYKDDLTKLPEATKVTLQEKDGGYVIPTAEPGYIYLVTVTYEQGTVEYGFWVKDENGGK